MIRTRKQIALSLIALILFLGLAAPLSAQKWVPLNDEYSIDYESMTLKLFLTANTPGAWGVYDETWQKAGKKMADFISNLNVEDSDKKFKTILLARPMLDAKVKAGVSDNLKHSGNSVIEQNKLYLRTYTIDLKTIKTIAPEMELPRPSK